MGITNIGNGFWSLSFPEKVESPNGAGGGYLRQSFDAIIDETRHTPDMSKALSRIPKTSLFLHVKWHYNGYLLYSEYYFEAWVTEGADGGPQFPVDSLSLRWRHGSVTGEEVGEKTSMVAKDDRTYNVGTDTDICVIATARMQGFEPWSVVTPDGCTWKS
ncbi:hypothetical protein [Massilia antarctica]|uniref:hypothetical protein n=1 Tax=Massilia antarctica TaxID=2765360 RepID=UPI00226E29E8|nr:hypothetical protein [Massilia sp. H27-R4]MCY0916316.1 hypothetical protein [Massilia sp. H27-R4]